MRQVLRIAVLSCISIVVAATASAEKRWTVTGEEVPGFAGVDDMIRSGMVRHDITASSVAITKDGRLVYARGYTWDEPAVEPVQPTSLFRTGSIAKSITSIAIHQLIEKGLLSYNTRVADYLGLEPPLGRAADPRLDLVTVDHLLTHTVGWDKYNGGIDPMVFQDVWVALSLGVLPPPTRHEIAMFMTGQQFQFNPGARWAYCNFGYLLLQMLAEKAAGVDFPEYVHENLFRAVGVGRARMARSSLSDLAPTERNYVGDYEGDPYALGWENAYAAGGMVMSAPDLARLYTALFDDPAASGLLKPETLRTMLSMPFNASREIGYGRGWIFEKFFVDSGHTVGWLTDPDDGLEIYSHGGGGPGVHAIAMWRTDGIGFFWVSNKDPLINDFDDIPEVSVWPEHDLWESVGISRGAAGSAPVESWVPSVARVNGVGESVWRSDVGLLNRTQRPNEIRLRLYNGWNLVERELELGPGESRVVSDVVGWFGQNGSGPLQVYSSEPLTVTSRTYNDAPIGTFGQSFDVVTGTGGLQSGESAVLMQLREDSAARTNIGICNQWPRSARVEIALHDGDGTLVATQRRPVLPLQTVQLNRPFLQLGGRNDIVSGYAVITVLAGQDVYAYASVIDNTTADPSAIPMKSGTGSRHQWVAAAAHADGARGSLWRTDVTLLNVSGQPVTAEVTYRGEDGGTGAMIVRLPAGRQTVLGDAVALLGQSGSGAIEITADGPVMAGSRTYNSSGSGTFGLFLDGVPATRTLQARETVWLPQLHQNERFRTNIGLVNTGSSTARVRLALFAGSGDRLATAQRTLEAGAWLQLQEPFARLAGRSDIDAGYASIEVVSGTGVIAYAAVIDNATNDGTAVPMKR